MLSVATALALGLPNAVTVAPITTTQTDQFKIDLFNGGHNFSASGGLTYKALLLKVSPVGTYGKASANVGTPGSGAPSSANVGTDEVTGTGYTTGGFTLTNVSSSLSGDTATVTFLTNPSWGPTATFTTSGLIIYTTDATKGTAGRTVATFDFGGPQTVIASNFIVNLATGGLIRSL